MSIQTKKGFTLIELMVVIVIIGILAAIAIPKLFGMTAKAKAQEVGPAAGTWVKLQLAYKMETGKFGSTDLIGYSVPGGGKTSNFEYTVNGAKEWKAESLFSADNCPEKSAWSAEIEYTAATETGKESSVKAGWDVPRMSLSETKCLYLTPNYYAIGCTDDGGSTNAAVSNKCSDYKDQTTQGSGEEED